MKVTVKIAKNDALSFDDYNEAMDYIEQYLPEMEVGALNIDDIIIDYHD
jgi:exonuclease VII small subunit